MEDLRIAERPELREPVLIIAYRGWNDAGSAASHAVEYLVRQLEGKPFASIDPEEYYDFTQARPITRPIGEYQRALTWPGNDFYYSRQSGRSDVVLLLATEPHLKWRRYGENVVGLAKEIGVSESLALGALLADTPHTRPVPVSGGSSTPELATRLESIGVRGSRYEGPTGILSVVGSMLTEAGIPNGSIWAATPHYISASPNPRASAALVRRLNGVFAIEVPLAELETEAEAYEAQVESALSGNLEAQQYVRELELHSPASPDDLDSDLSPDVEAGEPLQPGQEEGLIRSIEEFLRERQREQDGEGGTRS